eukprot:TRINITY_DN44952_c0_g1_i1.p1 TRINITY_DN44952_c0_g1~~TRINITY_DN44952_c0_g1_i1.p1  ORF type:complete len:241 (-),score=26.88 TRINITY_DN44952_c0_g1_i1:93-791(-)
MPKMTYIPSISHLKLQTCCRVAQIHIMMSDPVVMVKNTFIHFEPEPISWQRHNTEPAVPKSFELDESSEAELNNMASSDCSTRETSDIEAQLTTVMFRNIPESYTREMLVDLFNKSGFKGYYDFVYLPINFRTDLVFGYAFVNFVDGEALSSFSRHFNGFKDWGLYTDKVAEVSVGCKLQGLEEHVRRYRDSPVMYRTVPDKHKPILFRNGVRVPFPPPTKKLRAPRMRGSH